MSRYREHREAIREFEHDVFYEAWRAGMNPDRAVECASDCYWDGKTPQECVEGHARAIRRARDEESDYYDPDAL